MSIKDILKDINKENEPIASITKNNTEKNECNCIMCKNRYKIVIGVASFLFFSRIFFHYLLQS